jgi:hypothetical protein
MAVFTDNDRSKVNDEIDIDDVDEVEEDEADQGDQDDSADDKGKDENEADKGDDHAEADQDADKSKDKKPDEEKGADYWKNKFTESSRENQLERERREQAEKRAEELSKPKEVTDDLMKQKYPDWDNYDDGVKAALKNTVVQEQKIAALEKGQSEYHNERKWQSQIDGFLAENDETEKIVIKDKDAFKKYCNKPERKGMSLDILAAAFAYEVGTTAPAQPAKKKGSMLETGSGQGATNKHKTDKKEYTAEDAKMLRLNNPKEYERLVRSGKLDIKI